ncbi:MAG: hypothetical protein ACRDZU_09345 [Acidimicrobiales bacterium]
MRVERLVIEAGEHTFTLDLHPRLTIVAGMGRVERESLIGEIIGALGGSRPGVHVELEERSGRHLAVFRPTNGRHRIVDVDRARDVTAEMADAAGDCDLLEHLGLDPAAARRAMRFGSGDLATSSDRGKAIEVLAGLDQRRVWAAAEALHQAEDDLSTEAEARGSAPEDAVIIDTVEARHYAVERAAEAFETTRKRTFYIGGGSAIATIPGVMLAQEAGLGFVGVAAIAAVASLVARARLIRASRAEEQALKEAGANTYLGFQLERVNTLLGDDTNRRALMGRAGTRRGALTEWQQLAGEIPVEWALEHREEIQAAARLRREVDALGTLSTTAPSLADDATDALVHALVTRIAQARSLAGEGVPLLLDDPFQQLDASMKPLLLELLGRSGGEPQIVFLTEDEDVASWARLEALTGDLALIEPRPAHDETLVAPAPHR